MAARTPAEVFPPGEFIREELEARGWKQADLADILERPVPVVNEILSGKTGITPETAKGLAAAFGTSPELWLNLDSAYQLSRVRDPLTAVTRRARLYEKAPVREMIRRKWIDASRDIELLERRILEFFSIESLDDEINPWPHAARRSTSYDEIPPALSAWLFRAKSIANAIDAAPYQPRNMRNLVGNLRPLLESREETRKVPRLLAEAGIRLLIIEPLSRTRVDGASLWLSEIAPVIVLSLRYDRIDAFWHTLLHELGHIDKRDGLKQNNPLDLNIVGPDAPDDKPQFEKEADDFAASALIDPNELDDFIMRVKPLYSRERIAGFAGRIKVHPGIVVGQLQFRGEISYAHSRQLLEPVREVVTRVTLTDGWGFEGLRKASSSEN